MRTSWRAPTVKNSSKSWWRGQASPLRTPARVWPLRRRVFLYAATFSFSYLRLIAAMIFFSTLQASMMAKFPAQQAPQPLKWHAFATAAAIVGCIALAVLANRHH